MAAQYRAIADDLRKDISSGRYPPGMKLPRQQDIAAEYGVSDITVRKAVEVLRKEGLVESRGRGGHVVREHPDRARLITRNRQIERDHLGYYSGPEVQHWRALPWSEGEHATRIEQALPPADVAATLGVSPGTPLTVRRRLIGDPDQSDHRQLADSWLPTWVTDGIPALTGQTGAGGMYDRVEEWSGRALEWREEVSVRMPAPDEVRHLRMPDGAPLLRAVRVTYLPPESGPDPLIVEVQDIRMSGALWSLAYPLQRAPSAAWPPPPATSDYYKAP
ncbi:GntR family transcriptional regulator [Streptomyces albidoflavus]|uniref:GntR family transcriptional regulator n=1 Tax=Streptomyces albidoflavus TaxID=1886 RepID=UPI0013EEAB34|nr:GntR family transcriptional regulator [Streptomyces albidoflavus]